MKKKNLIYKKKVKKSKRPKKILINKKLSSF